MKKMLAAMFLAACGGTTSASPEYPSHYLLNTTSYEVNYFCVGDIIVRDRGQVGRGDFHCFTDAGEVWDVHGEAVSKVERRFYVYSGPARYIESKVMDGLAAPDIAIDLDEDERSGWATVFFPSTTSPDFSLGHAGAAVVAW